MPSVLLWACLAENLFLFAAQKTLRIFLSCFFTGRDVYKRQVLESTAEAGGFVALEMGQADKDIRMGCGSRAGKMIQHAAGHPEDVYKRQGRQQ